MRLPTPTVDDAVAWAARHLGDLCDDEVRRSPGFRGGQTAADHALATLDVSGYSAGRNQVWPASDRGATRLSPYIRHGLLTLPRVWEAVGSGPGRDVAKLRDELRWQEYARHRYARVGGGNGARYRISATARWTRPAWDREMACVDLAVGELEADGWLPNQARMWLASQWTVRAGADWTVGEDAFYRHLLDGSRAANRLGWLWTSGQATGRPYGFSRWQVERRAPGLCRRCPLRDDCPIEDWPPDPHTVGVADPHPRLRRDPDPEATAGPAQPFRRADPERVWLTAESLGDADPALAANPGLSAVFCFDEPLLVGLRLSGKRLVFLADCLADLARRRSVEVRLGDPANELAGDPLAVTFAPVPGFRRLAARLSPAELHPWPWLHRPQGEPVTSFTAWRKAIERHTWGG